MKILVTGGTGAVGQLLLPRLKEKGHSIKLLVLSDDPCLESIIDPEVEICIGDITDIRSLEKHFENIDSVIHLAAEILNPRNPKKLWNVNVNGTQNLLNLCNKGNILHFVYISSISVTYPLSNHYSRSKIAAEKLVTGYTVGNQTIIRPSLVYCENGGQEFKIFVEHLKRYGIIPFIGNGKVKKAPVFLEDMVQAISQIPGNPRTFGKIYNLASNEPVSLRTMADLLLRHMGKPKYIFAVPVFLCRIISKLSLIISKITVMSPLLTQQTITGLTQDAVSDTSLAEADLKFTPRNFSKGIKELISLQNILKP